MSTKILPFTDANRARVSSLFRKALRTAFDHSMKFDVYRNEAIKIRSQFEANKNIDDPERLEKVIAQTLRKLGKWGHPEPYITPCRPGGTKHERNIEPPKGPKVPGDW